MNATPTPQPGPGQYAQAILLAGIKSANFDYHRDSEALRAAVKTVAEYEQKVATSAQKYLEYSTALAALNQIMPGLVALGTIIPESIDDIAELPEPGPQPLAMDLPALAQFLAPKTTNPDLEDQK